MTLPPQIEEFLSKYDKQVHDNALGLRKTLLATLPNITEQLDLPAKMIAYCYGQKYSELVCVIIPSKKGLKLGLNQGITLPDPEKLLEGTGKISRYVQIKNAGMIHSDAVKELVLEGLAAYEVRINIKK